MKKQMTILAATFFVVVFLCSCAGKPDFSAPDQHPAGREWTMSAVAEELGGNDPIEPFNRSMFAVHDVFMQYLIYPFSWIYGSILPEQAIRRIDMVSKNMEFPGRMTSCFLQAKWKYGGVEFLRFLTNSTVGIAGLFDPADAWFGLPGRQENMGQAFASWGIGPGCIMVLPGTTATNPRDHVGTLFDVVLDLKFLLPYAQSAGNLNGAVRRYDSYKSLVESSPDMYETFKLTMLAMRYAKLKDLQDRQRSGEKVEENPPASALKLPREPKKINAYYDPENKESETLRVVYFAMRNNDRSWWIKSSLWNSDFISLGKKRSVSFSEDLPDLKYRLWAKSGRKTLAVVLPGVGAHYTARPVSALAELLNDNGYAVAVMSSSMNWTFAEAAGLKAPGYVPDDAAKIRTAIQLIVKDVKEHTELKEFDLVLVGYSLGGLHIMKLAGMEDRENTLNVKRYLALNPPVDLMRSMLRFDQFVSLSKPWNREKLFNHADEVMIKYLPLMTEARTFPVQKTPEALKKEYEAQLAAAKERGDETLPEPPVPVKYRLNFRPEVAAVMVGLSFRLTLRELILSAARRDLVPENALKTKYSWFNRSELYKEIDGINGFGYVGKFVLPQYPEKTLAQLREESGLRSEKDVLTKNEKIRVIHNLNDPILGGDDILFLDRTLGSRITWFDRGGHLGNLYLEEYQKTILENLEQKEN